MNRHERHARRVQRGEVWLTLTTGNGIAVPLAEIPRSRRSAYRLLRRHVVSLTRREAWRRARPLADQARRRARRLELVR